MGDSATTSRLDVLYIEDKEPILELALAIIADKFKNLNVRAVRSYERAREEVEDGFQPDFAILDCSPLRRERDDEDSLVAGDFLNEFLHEQGIRVIVLSGLDVDTIKDRDTYRQYEPLDIVSKPVSEEKIARMIQLVTSEREADQEGNDQTRRAK